MKINVMGASGQLGQKVMAVLLEQGAAPEDLIASVRTLEKAANLKEAGIEVRCADYEKPESLVKAFAGTDVLHLIPSVANVEPRILQHCNAVEAAQQAGVKRMAFSSLSSAGFPDSRFVITPFMQYAEMKLRQSGMAWTILRDNMYLDPVSRRGCRNWWRWGICLTRCRPAALRMLHEMIWRAQRQRLCSTAGMRTSSMS